MTIPAADVLVLSSPVMGQYAFSDGLWFSVRWMGGNGAKSGCQGGGVRRLRFLGNGFRQISEE